MAWRLFIPHSDNNYKPHLLRKNVTIALALAILVVQFAFVVSVTKILPQSGYVASVLVAVIVDETNSERVSLGLTQLTRNKVLDQAAQEKANDMATREYFSHISPEGNTPWYWLDITGYDYQYAGENLAVNFTDSHRIVNAWMKSPSHRANMVNGVYTEIGMATAEGMYKGKLALFVVQFFGTPQQATVAPYDPFAPIGPAATYQTAFFEKFITAPHRVITYLYAALALLISLAVVLKIVIRTKVRYPELVAHGVALVLILGSLMYLNAVLIDRGTVF